MLIFFLVYECLLLVILIGLFGFINILITNASSKSKYDHGVMRFIILSYMIQVGLCDL